MGCGVIDRRVGLENREDASKTWPDERVDLP
jgi:hypothetical protein